MFLSDMTFDATLNPVVYVVYELADSVKKNTGCILVLSMFKNKFFANYFLRPSG